MNLLTRVGLENRIFSNADEFIDVSEISVEQWAHVSMELEIFRRSSFDYIYRMTSGKKQKKSHSIDALDKFRCFGCSACADICKHNALSMVCDNEGFTYPQKNDKCTNCGLCEKICPIEKKYKNNKEGYLAYNLDEQDLKNSSSGGVYPALCKIILEKGGFVVGVKWTDDIRAVYDIADNYEKAFAFRHSKYVEPEHNNIFETTKNALDKDITVLFTGSPCKIAGLKAYLGKDYVNLITCDIICHGGASPLVFKKYVEAKSSEKGSKLMKVRMRSPNGEQSDYGTDYFFENDAVVTEFGKADLYTKVYLKNLLLRKSCYLCQFCLNHCSDFTIGDFWGWKKFYDNPDGKPISALVVNTERGQHLFEELQSYLFVKKVKVWDIFGNNHFFPCAIPPERADVIKRIAGGDNCIDVFKECFV